MTFFTRQSAGFGELVLAANAVLLNFQQITSFGLDGFVYAAEALVGKSIGERDGEAFQQVFLKCLQWSAVIVVLLAVVYALAGGFIVDLITDIARVRVEAYRYMPWIVAMPLVSVWSFLLDGVFVGAFWARQMRDAMAFSVLGCFLPAWYLLTPWGNHGLWAALLLFMLARGLTLAFSLKRWPPYFLKAAQREAVLSRSRRAGSISCDTKSRRVTRAAKQS